MQARRAEAVDGHGRDAVGQAGQKADLARDVQTLLGFGVRAAEDDVFNLLGRHLRRSSEGFFDHERGEVVRPHGAQAAVRRFAHRRAHGGYDEGFFHAVSSSMVCRS